MAKNTYFKSAGNNKLKITLKALKLNKKYCLNFNPKINLILLERLILKSPTSLSNLGKKFDAYKIRGAATDPFIKELLKELQVDNAHFFRTFSGKKAGNDLSRVIKEAKGSCLFLRVDDCGIINSLYASIRNALAHGNILYIDNYYILYSVSNKNGEKLSEEEKYLNFFLRIDSLEKLLSYITVLDSHEK